MGVDWGVREGMGDAKTCFSTGRAVYVYYFKDIRQGRYSLCNLFSGARVNTASINKILNASTVKYFL